MNCWVLSVLLLVGAVSVGESLQCYHGCTVGSGLTGPPGDSTLKVSPLQISNCSSAYKPECLRPSRNDSSLVALKQDALWEGNVSHCIIFEHLSSNQTDYLCDLDDLCTNFQQGRQTCLEGSAGVLHCCGTDLCNVQRAQSTVDAPRTFCIVGHNDSYTGQDCGFGACFNISLYDISGRILSREFGCVSESEVCAAAGRSTNESCSETTLPSGLGRRSCRCSGGHLCNADPASVASTATFTTHPLTYPPTILHFSESTMTSNTSHTSSSSASASSSLASSSSPSSHWLYLVAIGAMVVGGLVAFTLVALAVRRWRGRHARLSTYTYAQLTLDLAEDERNDAEDERMLIG